MLNKTEVVLVDESDSVIGRMEKLEAHQKGLLHRAFSIFVFNSKNELLIHKRAEGKYHSSGLWTNTCCSHPMPNETILDAAHRRLQEEMGFDCELKSTFSFIYRVELDNKLVENELDHVVIGKYELEPVLNVDEASAFKWIALDQLEKDIEHSPENYTFWFKLILAEHKDKLNLNQQYESL